LEQPELREFKGNPVQTVLADRGKYIGACLTICRAYAAAGRRPLASFEGWSDAVRSPLVWLGEADPAKSIQETRAEDPERVRLQNLPHAWEGVVGVGYDKGCTLGEAEYKGKHAYDHDAGEALLNAMLAVAPRRGEPGVVDFDRLGKAFRSYKGKVVDGRRFVAQRDPVTQKPQLKRGLTVWCLEKV
jgi:hypothetical protein